ncbi:hypothetical protein BH09SUM1_BH09SUM1_05720 [soil metagenome]
MKVVIAHRSGQPRVVELPEPKASKDFVSVRVSHTALLLPQELQQIEAGPKKLRKGDDGIPLGSSASGVVIEVGANVRSIKTGVRVAVWGHPYVYHASHLVVPEVLVVELPKKVNHEEGAFVGQGVEALSLLRAGKVQLGEVILVMGADMVGLLTAQAVRAAGGTPILIDESDYRLGKAKTVGLANAFQPDDEQLMRLVDSLTDGNGADAALLTRENESSAWKSAATLLRREGSLVVGASISGSVPIGLIHEKSIQVTHGGMSETASSLRRWSWGDNARCFCQLLAERKIQITPLITDRVPLDRAPIAYEKAARGRDAALGVVLTI